MAKKENVFEYVSLDFKAFFTLSIPDPSERHHSMQIEGLE